MNIPCNVEQVFFFIRGKVHIALKLCVALPLAWCIMT